MKTIKRLFREVRIETTKIAFLNAFLNSCILFFAVYLGLILFDYSYTYAVIAAVLFFIGDFIYWKRKLNLKAVEDANPAVKEMLRTAHDYQDEKNALVLGLFYDLVKNMKEVSAGNMLDSNILFKKVLAITFLTFAVVALSSAELYLGNIALPGSGSTTGFGNVFSGDQEPGQAGNQTLERIGFNESRGLYGNSSVATLGKEELNLNINPGMNQLDFDKQKSLEDQEFNRDSYPVEASAQASDYSGNDVPDEAELAKEYNLKLRGD
jgi:hypothetical protein